MKIGILTFQWAINYGAVLQMFALKTYLEMQGHEILIINYSPKELKNQYSLNVLSNNLSMKKRLIRIIENFLKKSQHDKFERFLLNNFNMSKSFNSSEELKNIVKTFDLVIVGSDQVWNKDITKNYLKNYLLYSIDCKKISYAASIGSKTIPSEELDLFKKSLKDFLKISVREKHTAEQLCDIVKNKKIENVLDPVFLLSKDEWFNLLEIKKTKRKFILIYMLENNQGLLNAAEKLQTETNFPVYSIEIPHVRRIKNSFKINLLHDVGPSEFLELIFNAEYILTNSFHGTSFSLIFEKKFLSFTHSSANLRIENLLKIYGLKDVQIDDDNTDINEIKHNLYISNKATKKHNLIVSQINKSKEFLSKLY